MQKSKVGLSFAGGGLKSFAHVAVTQDLEAHQIDIQAVSGTSMGSVLAALYASGVRGRALEEKLLELEDEFSKQKVLSWSSFKIFPFNKDRSDGLIEQKVFETFAKKVFDDIGITMLSEIEMPVCIAATDLITEDIILFSNKPEYFTTTGSDCRFYPNDIEISKAITASCAFPLVFQSVEIDDLRLVDGGVRINLPSKVFNRDRIEKIVGITTLDTEVTEIEHSLMAVLTRSLNIMMSHIEKQSIVECDVHINFPTDVMFTFEVGKGLAIINRAKTYLKQNPIDYKLLENKKKFSNFWGLIK